MQVYASINQWIQAILNSRIKRIELLKRYIFTASGNLALFNVLCKLVRLENTVVMWLAILRPTFFFQIPSQHEEPRTVLLRLWEGSGLEIWLIRGLREDSHASKSKAPERACGLWITFLCKCTSLSDCRCNELWWSDP